MNPTEARLATKLREHYDNSFRDGTGFGPASLCAHCTDNWADNIAAVVVTELGLK
jgi:hypothetical protein